MRARVRSYRKDIKPLFKPKVSSSYDSRFLPQREISSSQLEARRSSCRSLSAPRVANYPGASSQPVKCKYVRRRENRLSHAIVAACRGRSPNHPGFQTVIVAGFPRVCALSIRTSAMRPRH